MGRRAAILVGAGLAALSAAGAAWFDHDARTFLTDGGAIRQPASSAPAREVLWTPPTPMSSLSTGDDDYEPRLTSDGQNLYFVRGRAGHNADIYTSHRTRDGWSAAEPLAGVNTDKDELGPELSPDEQSLYFASNRDGGAGGYDLWVSRRDGDAWSVPTNLGPINSADNEYNPALTPDGRTIYFSSNRLRPDETAGDKAASWPATVRENIPGHDFDLYRAPTDGSTPAQPAWGLNSLANDGTPAFSPAGDFIYFASDREHGAGGFDLYRARLHQGEPGRVESLGSPVNTDANELDPALDMGGFALHFSSDRRPQEPREVAEATRDYNLFESVSHEVYRVTEPPTAARWASMLQQILPWIIWFLISLLTVLLFLLLWRAQRNKHLSLLTRCLIGSLLVHLVILFLLSLWGVSTSLGVLFHKPGGTKVRLASAGTGDALATQVRGSSPMLPMAITMAPPTDAPVRTMAPDSTPIQTETSRSAPDADQLASQLPTLEAPAPSRPPDSRPRSVPHRDPRCRRPNLRTRLHHRRARGRRHARHTLHSRSQPQRQPGSPGGRPGPSHDRPRAGREPRGRRRPDRSICTCVIDSGLRNVAGNAPGGHGRSRDTGGIGARAATEEPAAQVGIAHTVTPEPGPAIGPSATQAETSAAAPARSSPDAGQTLAGTQDSAAASPATSPTTSADLSSDKAAFDLALPSDRAAAPGANATEPQGTSAATAAVGTSEPAPAIATGGSSPNTPTAAPAGVSAGPSLAEASQPDLAAATAATPARAPGLTPGAAAFDLALPDAQPATAAPVAATEAGGQPGASVNLGASEPAPLIAAGGSPAGSPTAAPSGVSAGPSLARASESGLAAPAAATPSRAAGLTPGATAFDLALPDADATDATPLASTEAGSQPGASLNVGASEPAPSIAVGGSPAISPTTTPSGVSAGSSLAKAPESGLAAPAATTPSRTAGLTPGAATFDLALPEADPTATTPLASTEAGSQPGASLNLGASEPTPPLAATATATDGPEASRSEVSTGLSLAAADPAESTAPPSPAPASVALAPTDAAADIALPQDTAPPEDLFAQRDPEHRMDIVERLGGSRETEEAVARSLSWLAAHQSEDGRWSSGHFDDHCGQCGGQTKISSDHAVTGLALLCFLASDHTPNKDGPYRTNVDRAVRWLVSEQKASGDLRGDETMYSHGIVTIALAEAYGMTGDRALAEPVKQAIAFIAGARNSLDGGWRYEPGEPGDTSVLGWQAMALTSAKRAGITVPADAIGAADHWLDSVSAETPGWYGYQPGMPPTHAMTAEGMYIRQILGHGRDEPIMLASVDRIMRNPPMWNERPSTYAWYYATLALFQHGGPEWTQWNAQLTKELLGHQRTAGQVSGSWDPEDRWAQIGGRVYQTAICTLSLEVYYRYLPMYAVAGGEAPGPNGATQPSP